MESVSKEGRTILFVSHNMSSISTLCDRAIFLEDCRLKYEGNTSDVIKKYDSPTTYFYCDPPYWKTENYYSLHDFDRVTLYRTINSLMKSGIIHKASVGEKETFYAVCSSKCSSDSHTHKHIHFKCSNCKAVTCVQADSAINFAIPGHTINNFEIEATGICVACN